MACKGAKKKKYDSSYPYPFIFTGKMSRHGSSSSDDEGVTINFPHHNLGFQGKNFFIKRGYVVDLFYVHEQQSRRPTRKYYYTCFWTQTT